MFTVLQRTMSKRKRAKLEEVKKELRKMHQRGDGHNRYFWGAFELALAVVVSLPRGPSMVLDAAASQPDAASHLGADVPIDSPLAATA
jgi:hypothetical protein